MSVHGKSEISNFSLFLDIYLYDSIGTHNNNYILSDILTEIRINITLLYLTFLLFTYLNRLFYQKVFILDFWEMVDARRYLQNSKFNTILKIMHTGWFKNNGNSGLSIKFIWDNHENTLKPTQNELPKLVHIFFYISYPMAKLFLPLTFVHSMSKHVSPIRFASLFNFLQRLFFYHQNTINICNIIMSQNSRCWMLMLCLCNWAHSGCRLIKNCWQNFRWNY